MAYLFDGGFTGFLYSMKETGRKLKDGAKELVEDFVSGFNGNGWKLWKRNDSWRLEVDELLVRKSLTTFEMIISQITSIKGSQAITQGNGKIKSVTLVDSADIYKEIKIPTYATDFSVNWNTESLGASNPTISQNEYRIEINEPLDEYQKIFFYGTDVIDKFQFEVSNLNGSISLNYAVNGMEQMDLISTNGTYTFRGSDGTLPSDTKLGISFGKNTTCKIVQMPVVEEYGDSIIQSPCYRIELDNQQNTFTEYDLIRCQKGDKFYYVQIGSVFQYYVNIPVSEFETNDEGIVVNPPQEGDELVQFGNASHQDKYKNRHSAIYLHLDENEPAIDLMTDIYSKDWSVGNIIKTRIGGNLPGTDGDRGFYCVNGKILSVDENGDTVYIINPDGSASFARGKLSWSKDGSPVFSGDIKLVTSTNNVWEVDENGLNLIGDKKGKRIEINASTSDIKIFNRFNEISTILEGVPYYTLEELFETAHTNIELKNIPYIYRYSSSDVMPQIVEISNVFYTSNTTDIYYKYNIQINNELATNISSSVVIKLKTYSDEGLTNLTHELILIGFVYNRQGYETKIAYQEEKNLITKGYHIITVEFNSISNSMLSLAEFSIRLSLTGYISRYYSNGLALGTSIDNVSSCYNDAYNNMNALFTNEKYGLKITSERILSRNNGLWGMIPSIVCIGRVSGISSDYAYLSYRTFDNSTMPAIRRNGVGWVTITFPTSWNIYKFDFSNAYVMLTGIGTSWDDNNHTYTDSPIKATFRVWRNNPNGFDVLLSDDATNNDGDFIFEVKLLQ